MAPPFHHSFRGPTDFDHEAGHSISTGRSPTDKFGMSDKRAEVRKLVEDDLLDERYAQTKRGLKSRHVQMMALGGSIGTGLFVSTGQALATGGPAFLFGCYVFMASMVYCIVTAIAEIATYLPIHGGSMSYYGFRYVSRSMGFALGWLYWYAMGMLVPNEITAAALVIGYWNPEVHIAVWITIMLVVIIGLNCLPVRWYGESEFWFCSLKVITLVGLLFLSFILFWGGGPDRRRLGFHYWMDPGATKTSPPYEGDVGRIIALLQTLILSAFAFIFVPELVVVSAGEMESPRYNVPRASRRFFFRLIFFYILGVLSITVICPSSNQNLTSGGAGAGSSPFVAGIKHAGIPILDSIVNAVILTSAWSSGNTFVYMSSRTLYSLAVSGNAPSVFKSCNRYGLPYVAVAVSSIFAPLTYLSAANSRSVVFNWFVHLTNTSGLTSWICCCIIYLRFRKATDIQGVNRPYKSIVQPWGTYVALCGATFLLLINGFHVFLPGQWSVSRFFTAYVGIPVFLALYFGHRLLFRGDPWAWDLRDIDLHTGLVEVEAADRPRRVRDRWWKKVMVLVE